jgi:Domain of unknown function (DUF6997)/Domain of unknown function (DUF6996)
MTNTSRLWEQIFAAKQFDLREPLHFITADELKAITRAEPRILAKMDSSAALPPVFKRNGYFLLPVKNGKYAIVRGEGFHRLEPGAAPAEHASRIRFHLTTAGRGSSEMQYLDYSFNAGALESAVGISPLYQSIRGREYSRAFRFFVNQTLLSVSSIQLEVDSGLEGEEAIVLVEAKMGRPEDFIIRQLFYPYNHFRLVSPGKKIVPVFFTYEAERKVFNFWIYEFTDPGNYNSIRLKDVRAVTIAAEHPVELADIQPKRVVSYKNLIPQANDLNKVIELAFKVNEGLDTYKEVADYFHFDERQSNYYREAAEALGLVVREKGCYRLTDTGKHLVGLPVEERNLFVVGLVSEFDLVRHCLDTLRSTGRLTRKHIKELIAKESHLTGSTVPRRAGSLAAWLRWIAAATGSLVEDKNGFRVRE